jgi:hypothetical protein
LSVASHIRIAAAVALFSVICGCGGGYERRDGEVVFVTWDEGQGRREHPLPGVDPSSFRALNDGFATDASSAYFEWKRIADANSGSFVVLSELYARDGARVFYRDEVVANADPATFELLGVVDWGRDRRDVYHQSSPIDACDPPTFEFLADDWQRDSRCVYNGGRPLPDADPASFTVVNYSFAKDKDRVFHNGAGVLAGADPQTFRPRGKCTVCGEDKGGCYRFDEAVPCDGTQ